MFDGLYEKIGVAGVVLAFLPLFSLYFFIQPLIYPAWGAEISHGVCAPRPGRNRRSSALKRFRRSEA
jgi:hypothetical protein